MIMHILFSAMPKRCWHHTYMLAMELIVPAFKELRPGKSQSRYKNEIVNVLAAVFTAIQLADIDIRQ